MDFVKEIFESIGFLKDVFLFVLILLIAGCLTCWCPCITFGRVAEIVDKGSSCKYSISN